MILSTGSAKQGEKSQSGVDIKRVGRHVGAYVGYAERNSANEHAIQRLQNPAVTSPRICVSVRSQKPCIFLNEHTPNHTCTTTRCKTNRQAGRKRSPRLVWLAKYPGRNPCLTYIKNGKGQPKHWPRNSRQHHALHMLAHFPYHVEWLRWSSGRWPMAANRASSPWSGTSFIVDHDSKTRIFTNPRTGDRINLSISPIQTHQEGIARRVLFVVKLR